ncbi:hypothetical protein HK102_000872 [Quaeritorhiza haematococci]|nr:hypothetical protein HK102_000872 [Quaeritorhiza haematococci]
MKRNGTYGGNMEVVAFARHYGVDIAVHQAGSPVWIVKGDNPNESTSSGSPPHPRRLLHIVYHSWEHYSSIRNVGGPMEGPPEIRIKPDPSLPPLEERPSDAPPSSMELMILRSCDGQRNGVDLGRVRELLKKYRGNPNRVIDELFEEVARDAAGGEDAVQTSGDGEVRQGTDGTDEVAKKSEKDTVPKVDGETAESGQEHATTSTTSSTPNQDSSNHSSLTSIKPPTPLSSEPTPSDTATNAKSTKPKRVSARDKKEQARKLRKENAKAKKRKHVDGTGDGAGKGGSGGGGGGVEGVIEGIKVVHI